MTENIDMTIVTSGYDQWVRSMSGGLTSLPHNEVSISIFCTSLQPHSNLIFVNYFLFLNNSDI